MASPATKIRTSANPPPGMALVSMPWSLFNRPSIQLGSLKAYLNKHAGWLSVQASYPYLEVASRLGPDLYHWISQNSWVGEALYAALLFPEQKDAARKLALRYVRNANKKIQGLFDFGAIQTVLASKLQSLIEHQDWNKFQLVGFSVCFNQLLSSLAAAHSLKQVYPEMLIVLGGSSCAGDTGRSILDNFSFVDFVIEGEGEIPLLQLNEHLSGKREILPAGILANSQQPAGHVLNKDTSENRPQMSTLQKLPTPDFHEYFSLKQQLFDKAPFIPVIPIEFSRGCWWNRCNFCNLNLQWCGYRSKKAAQVLAEVQSLSQLHSCLDFTFTDNMLPPQESIQFFQATKELDSDLKFFAEIRSDMRPKPQPEPFSIYSQGGLSTIQVGIESLSNSLLNRMNKGVSVIENICAMRNALECAITLNGNLITQFPGSTPAEVAETMENLKFIFPYTPLSIAAFFLGHDSPVANDPKKFGIKAITDHPNNCRLFPRAVLKNMHLLVNGYRGDRGFQKNLWKPLVRMIGEWQNFHESRKESAIRKPLLAYRDGVSFLIIRQETEDGMVLNHRLQGLSRQIYLYCTEIRTKEEIAAEFQQMDFSKIQAFLDDLNRKRLLFTDDQKFLSLAVRNKA